MRLSRCLSTCATVLLLSVLAATGAEQPKTLEIGAPAPDFKLPGTDGREYSLKDFASARILVIVFTCNHCPTAQAYEDRVQKIAADYKSRGVALVAISPNDPLAIRLDELGYTDLSDSLEEMKIRAKDKGFTFPYLYDGEKQEVSRAMGPVATPHVFVFDGGRKLRYTGRVDDNEHIGKATTHDARNAIEALLEGRPVPVEKTKTFGCSIKWADKRASAKNALERWAREEVTLDPADPPSIKALLKNDSGKLRLINVWATWCGPCVVEFPELVTIFRMYRGREFELVTVSADEPAKRDAALAFLKKQQASTKNYLFSVDNKYKLIDAVDPQWPGSLPYTLLVEQGGKILYRQTGEFDPLALKKAIVGHLGRYYK